MSDINFSGVENVDTEQQPAAPAPTEAPAQPAPRTPNRAPRVGRYNQETGETTYDD